MGRYSKNSNSKLNTIHEDLQKVFRKVVEKFDNTILYGNRSIEEQFELFKKGRKFVDGEWVIVDKDEVVTYCDGYKKKSEHNYTPSRAVDAVPYPIEWNNMNRMRFFVGYVLGVADEMYRNGEISHRIGSGMDWDNDTILKDQRFKDIPHFRILI